MYPMARSTVRWTCCGRAGGIETGSSATASRERQRPRKTAANHEVRDMADSPVDCVGHDLPMPRGDERARRLVEHGVVDVHRRLLLGDDGPGLQVEEHQEAVVGAPGRQEPFVV